MGNQLNAYSGKDKVKHQSHDVKNIYFRWDGDENQLNDELVCMKRKNYMSTELTIDAVYPDKWNKMQVRYTKAVFSKRTLIDATAKYADLLNIKDEMSKIKVDR